jgi:hypothetical protein
MELYEMGSQKEVLLDRAILTPCCCPTIMTVANC